MQYIGIAIHTSAVPVVFWKQNHNNVQQDEVQISVVAKFILRINVKFVVDSDVQIHYELKFLKIYRAYIFCTPLYIVW